MDTFVDPLGISIATAHPQNDQAPFDPPKLAYWFPHRSVHSAASPRHPAPALFAFLVQGHARSWSVAHKETDCPVLAAISHGAYGVALIWTMPTPPFCTMA